MPSDAKGGRFGDVVEARRKPQNLDSISRVCGRSLRIETQVQRRNTPMSIKTKTLNVHADSPDLRDRIYSPTLRLLGKTYNAEPFADEAWAPRIKDQGQTSACTGFAPVSYTHLTL